MQTTLLGLAIAIILVLVTALVAPLVIDWNHYRSAFETEASRLTGLSVRVHGGIQARLLPTPAITLRDVDAGPAGQEPQLRTRTLSLELALGPLLRGQLQASELRVIGPQISVAIDPLGVVQWPALAPSGHNISISRLTIDDGRVVVADQASGGRLVLQKVWFKGDVRSLAGPFAGEGAVVVHDQLYGYRISGGRQDGAGGVRIRLGVDPSDYPLSAELDGALTFEHGIPQFDGTLALARPVGAMLANGRRVMSDPWRATAKLTATPASASLQEAALRYGPEERALNFTGSAQVAFGPHPHAEAAIAALQLDVGRALADPDESRRPPLVILRSFLESFVTTATLPMSAHIDVAINALTFGDTAIESLRGALHFDQTGWSVEQLGFTAPGFTEVKLSGRLSDTAQNVAFNGPASLESTDADALVAWLTARKESPSGHGKTLSARGDLTIGGERMAVEQMTATLDREMVQGRLAYNWPTANRPARVDAQLRAAQLDLDALAAFVAAASGDDGLALPQEGTLALDIGYATFAGIEARAVNAQATFEAGKLHIDRLSIGDLGGATLALSGHIDELSSEPRGQLTLDLDARALDGISGIVAKFAPGAAASLRHAADRLAPAKVHGVLTVDRSAAGGSTAMLRLQGTLATMRIGVDAKATGERAHLAQAVLTLNGQIDADDGTALTGLFGLDRVIAVDQLPARFTLSSVGPLNGDIHLNGRLSASGLDASAQGGVRFEGERTPNGSLQIQAAAGDLRPLHQMLTGEAGTAVAVSGHAALALNGSDWSFSDLVVSVGKASLRGRVAVNLTSPIGIDGDIAADEVDTASVAALLVGLPGNQRAGVWSNDPIADGVFNAINGRLKFKFAHAVITPALVAHDLQGVAHFSPAELALDDLDGSLAGGHVTGALAFRRGPDGLGAHAQLELAAANAATLLQPSLNVADGAMTMALICDGLGTTPAGLIGSFHGTTAVTLAVASFAGLDLAAFDAAMQAADPSGTVDPAKVKAAVAAALANGRLAVPRAEATLTITSGAINLIHLTLPAERGAELALEGSIDLAKASVDARMDLSAPPPPNTLIEARPEFSISLKGPLGAPQRTLDVSALVNWLTLRNAELQTRRLESLEANGRGRAIIPAEHADPPATRPVPQGIVVESAAPPNLLPAPASGARGIERLQPPPLPLSPAPDQSRPGFTGVAPALPPPLHLDQGTARAGAGEQSH